MKSISKPYFLILPLILALFSCNSSSTKKQTTTDTLNPCDFSKKISWTDERKIAKEIDASTKKRELNYYFDSIFATNSFNGCIYIEQKGITLFEYQNGKNTLNGEFKSDLNNHTLFQLASLSKTFTAIATLILIEESKISLEDSIQKFYPDFPYKGIDIRQLLSHRSGLPNYIYAFEKKSKEFQEPDNQQIMNWFIEDYPNIYFYPNRKFSYNNSNYAILAAIVEKVSGMSFSQFLHQRIFKPLNMNHSFTIDEIPKDEVVTKGHEGTNEIKRDYFDRVLGDKSVYSCMEDLKIWYRALHSECLLRKETMQIAFSPQSFEHKGTRNYGLGFRMILDDSTNQPKYVYHNGWWKGYNSLFWFSEKTGTFVLMLTNVKNKSIYQMKPLVQLLEPSDTSMVFEQEE
jgi:CubicO group peptidase (beta-lactamase class C family)